MCLDQHSLATHVERCLPRVGTLGPQDRLCVSEPNPESSISGHRTWSLHVTGTIVVSSLVISKMISSLHVVSVRDAIDGFETQQPSPPSQLYMCDVTRIACYVRDSMGGGNVMLKCGEQLCVYVI